MKIASTTEGNSNEHLHKVPKFQDTRKLRCKHYKIQSKRPKRWVICLKDAKTMANSEDPNGLIRLLL